MNTNQKTDRTSSSRDLDLQERARLYAVRAAWTKQMKQIRKHQAILMQARLMNQLRRSGAIKAA